jgi:hypothetical protein
MKTLDDVVRDTIQEFVKNGLLFTGLDVSNKVKETLPFARHSEVSELVRLSFVSEIEPSGYAKTPISVTLKDGSQRTAMLYHALADSWDLDNKYDSQKRSQVVVKPASIPVPATVSANGTVMVKPAPATIPAPTPVTVAQAQARDQWAGLFNSSPSLFPRK